MEGPWAHWASLAELIKGGSRRQKGMLGPPSSAALHHFNLTHKSRQTMMRGLSLDILALVLASGLGQDGIIHM